MHVGREALGGGKGDSGKDGSSLLRSSALLCKEGERSFFPAGQWLKQVSYDLCC